MSVYLSDDVAALDAPEIVLTPALVNALPRVTIGGQACSNVQVATDHKSLTCTTPALTKVGLVPIKVKAGIQDELTADFIYSNFCNAHVEVNPACGPLAGGNQISITVKPEYFIQKVNRIAGYLHTCALSTQGQAYCWGQGDSGELGNGAFSDSDTPQPVVTSGALAGKILRQITTGNRHTYALDAHDQAYCSLDRKSVV